MADSQQFRKKFFASNLVLLGIIIVILFFVFGLRDFFGGTKLDWTKDKIYTISEKTKEILAKLKDEVQIKYYCSEELPGQLKTLRRDTKDMFDEFYELSNKRVNYEIIDPEGKAKDFAQGAVAKYKQAELEKKKPEEPEPVQSMEDIFGNRPKPNAEQTRARRDAAAGTIAAQTKRLKQDVFYELLSTEYEKQYTEKLEQEGIRAITYNEQEASTRKQGHVFTAIEIKYLSREPEVIPVHTQIENLEYELTSRLLKLATPDKPTIAFFDARKPPAPPPNPMNPRQPPGSDYDRIVGALQDVFDVRTIDLKENDSIDDLVKRVKDDRFRKELEGKTEAEKKDLEAKQDKTVKPEDLKEHLKCLVVAQPDQLEPRQVYEISRAVSLGVPTIFFISKYTLDISDEGYKQRLPINMLMPGVEDLFRKWGIELGAELLASNEMGTIDIPQRVFGNMVQKVPAGASICVAATQDTLSQDSNLTSRIPTVIFPTTTGLKLNRDVIKKNSLEADELAWTVPETWSVKIDPFQKRNPFNPQAGMGATLVGYEKELVPPKDPAKFQDWTDKTLLAVLVRGKLPFSHDGETIPDWRKVEKGKENPHAGIPGMPGLPGMDFPGGIPGGPGEEEDRDLALNAEDTKPAAPAAPSVSPPPSKPLITVPVQAPPTPAPIQPAQPIPPPAPTTAAPNAAAPSTAVAPATATPPTVPPTLVPGVTPPPATPTAPGAQAEAKPAEKPKADVKPIEGGSVLILASADMMKNEYISSQSRAYQPNINFFYNAVENYALGNQLIEIRRKQITERRFKAGSDKYARFISWFNVAGVPAIVAALGIVYFLIRRADSVAYERRYIQKHQS